MKRFPSDADIDKLQTDIPSIIYRDFPTNIKFINGKSAHALSFSIISSFSVLPMLVQPSSQIEFSINN